MYNFTIFFLLSDVNQIEKTFFFSDTLRCGVEDSLNFPHVDGWNLINVN